MSRAKLHCLYRHFDAAGTLLYVGISKRFYERMRQHNGSSRWFPAVANISVERFNTLKQARTAEAAAVKKESPQFNFLAATKAHSLASKLRDWRKAQALSLDEMAMEIGCSPSALSLIERGKRTPGYALTMRIVSATGNKVKEADLHTAADGLEIGRGGGRK